MVDHTDADFTIICQGREWPVHKAIISQASPILAASCHSSMIEGKTNTREITMFAAEIVDHMVSYIYRRDYTLDSQDALCPPSISQAEIVDDGSANANVNDALLVHVEVFGIGEFLQIDLLKALAVEQFAAAAAKAEWQAAGFIDVVEKVNDRSGPSDRKSKMSWISLSIISNRYLQNVRISDVKGSITDWI